MTVLTQPYLVIDIETAPASQQHIDALMEAWKPPGNIKDPAKIAAKRDEAAARAVDKASLLDAAPIICIGYGHLDGDDTFNVVLHTLDRLPDRYDNESQMLAGFAEFLANSCSAATELVGHNIQSFDLPKLRHAYIRNALPIPGVLKVSPPRFQPCFDTMRNFRYFSTENYDNRFVSLETVCRTLGIPQDFGDIKGKDIAEAYELGWHEEILKHAYADIVTTLVVYQTMIGAPS
jgi:hypothetical protein